MSRVEECNNALKIINNKFNNNYSTLCDVSPHLVSELKNILETKIYNRASFVINENQRTYDASIYGWGWI